MRLGDRVIATFPDTGQNAGQIIDGPIAREGTVAFKVRFGDFDNWIPADWLARTLKPIDEVDRAFLVYAYNMDDIGGGADFFIGGYDEKGDAFFAGDDAGFEVVIIFDRGANSWRVLAEPD